MDWINTEYTSNSPSPCDDFTSASWAADFDVKKAENEYGVTKGECDAEGTSAVMPVDVEKTVIFYFNVCLHLFTVR